MYLDKNMHPDYKTNERIKQNRKVNYQEQEAAYWKLSAQQQLKERIQIEENLNENKAKNIIMFLGDGMSLQTVAATRMYMGGEELSLSFEKFPHFGLSKVFIFLFFFLNIIKMYDYRLFSDILCK